MPLLLRAVSLLLYVCGVARSVETATGGLFRARAPTTEEISLVLQEAEDQFNSLSESELRELGALYSSTDSIRAKMRELNKFEAITHIDVKLVGFDGDGQRERGDGPLRQDSCCASEWRVSRPPSPTPPLPCAIHREPRRRVG